MMAEDSREMRFGAAMQELEGILRRVEGEEIDIDELADELKRAAELLELCRAKIRRAEVEVSQIVQTLEAPGDEAPGDEAPGDDDPASDDPASAAAAGGRPATLFDTPE
jgi:exodeoxyribonuclease VII small subunit